MKRYSLNLLCLLMTLAVIMSCLRRHYRPSLKVVMKHNPALEQVLRRYEGNSLKTEAAEFLLMNLHITIHTAKRIWRHILRCTNTVE